MSAESGSSVQASEGMPASPLGTDVFPIRSERARSRCWLRRTLRCGRCPGRSRAAISGGSGVWDPFGHGRVHGLDVADVAGSPQVSQGLPLRMVPVGQGPFDVSAGAVANLDVAALRGGCRTRRPSPRLSPDRGRRWRGGSRGFLLHPRHRSFDGDRRHPENAPTHPRAHGRHPFWFMCHISASCSLTPHQLGVRGG